jgi:hypothetical protein
MEHFGGVPVYRSVKPRLRLFAVVLVVVSTASKVVAAKGVITGGTVPAASVISNAATLADGMGAEVNT